MLPSLLTTAQQHHLKDKACVCRDKALTHTCLTGSVWRAQVHNCSAGFDHGIGHSVLILLYVLPKTREAGFSALSKPSPVQVKACCEVVMTVDLCLMLGLWDGPITVACLCTRVVGAWDKQGYYRLTAVGQELVHLDALIHRYNVLERRGSNESQHATRHRKEQQCHHHLCTSHRNPEYIIRH